MNTPHRLLRLLGIAAVLALALGAGAAWAKTGGAVGTVAGVHKRVQVNRGGSGSWTDLEKGDSVSIGDIVRTGPQGRTRIEFNDRDDANKRGPSTMNIGPASEVLIEAFEIDKGDPGKSKSLFDLVKGTVRGFMKGWGANSSFRIKAGVSICGIRGSEMIVRHDPGSGKTWQSSLSGVVFTDSTDPSTYPERKFLPNNYQRYMATDDPDGWIDIVLSDERKGQLIEQTEVPGNNGTTEEELWGQRNDEGDGDDGDDGQLPPFGTSTTPGGLGDFGTAPPPLRPGDPWGGIRWTVDGVPDCTARAYDLRLNDYVWANIQDHEGFTFYKDELIGTRFVVSGGVSTTCARSDILDVEVSVDGGQSFAQALFNPSSQTFRYEFDPTGFTDLDLRVSVTYDRALVDQYRRLVGLIP